MRSSNYIFNIKSQKKSNKQKLLGFKDPSPNWFSCSFNQCSGMPVHQSLVHRYNIIDSIIGLLCTAYVG